MGDGRLSANCPANMRELLSIVPSNSVSPNPNAEVLRVPFNLSDCAEERYGSHCKGTGLALGQATGVSGENGVLALSSIKTRQSMRVIRN